MLFDQSHHMVDIYIEGPDALKLLSNLAINSFNNFPVNRAKQFVPCSYSGHVIGDGILFHLEQNKLVFVGRAPTANWIEFHAETGKYNVKITKDDRSPGNPKGKAVNRISYRFQIQGPNAWKVIEKLNGGPVPEIKFFFMGTIKIGKKTVRALRHGMAGAPGLEVWGPYEEREEIRDAIVAAGEEFGLKQVGSRAYATNTLESGWIPSPLPAVYTDERMKKYREWLPGEQLRGHRRPGRQLRLEEHRGLLRHAVRDRLRPVREVRPRVHRPRGAREDRGQAASPEGHVRVEQRRRREDLRVDVPATVSTTSTSTCRCRTTRRPRSTRSRSSGKTVGASMFAGYSYNERSMLSLGIVDPDIKIGDEVTLVWGEEDGGTKKVTVEPHKQLEIRAIVSPVPYSKVARETYAAGWRTGKA